MWSNLAECCLSSPLAPWVTRDRNTDGRVSVVELDGVPEFQAVSCLLSPVSRRVSSIVGSAQLGTRHIRPQLLGSSKQW